MWEQHTSKIGLRWGGTLYRSRKNVVIKEALGFEIACFSHSFCKNWLPFDFLYGFHCFRSCFVSCKHWLRCGPNGSSLKFLLCKLWVANRQWRYQRHCLAVTIAVSVCVFLFVFWVVFSLVSSWLVGCVGPASALRRPCVGLASALRRSCVGPASAMRRPCVGPAPALRRPCLGPASALRRACVGLASALRRPCVGHA